jgi:hypothetical protein
MKGRTDFWGVLAKASIIIGLGIILWAVVNAFLIKKPTSNTSSASTSPSVK